MIPVVVMTKTEFLARERNASEHWFGGVLFGGFSKEIQSLAARH